MWLSTKSEYGLRTLVDLARFGRGEPVPLRDIAQRQGISQHYLEQIAAALRRSGFVQSVRGAAGGYVLASEPARISAKDVVLAMEGGLMPRDCMDPNTDNSVCQAGGCATRPLWNQLQQAVEKVLSSTTVADLAAENERQSRNLTYHI